MKSENCLKLQLVFMPVLSQLDLFIFRLYAGRPKWYSTSEIHLKKFKSASVTNFEFTNENF